MKIPAITSFNISTYYYTKRTPQIQTVNIDDDIFIKTGCVSSRGTSAGNPLKKLKDISCPYSGIKMITGKDAAEFDKKLNRCRTLSGVIRLLTKYEKKMQPIEKKMLYIFKDYAGQNPKGNLQDCLKNLYNNSLTKLKLEEFCVLDEVDAISKNLSAETALALRKKTTRCREIIANNDSEDTFKRKVFLSSLNEITPLESEEKIFDNMRDKALFLPTSGLSENAFVVKYATRSQIEIARRLILASMATIEHVQPESLGGLNEIGNFILASAHANNYRSNMPLTKYIERFPHVPQNCQQYIDEIITKIHRGKLKGNETYPYQIKNTLAHQSNGLIDLDLSKYKYTFEKAQEKEVEAKTPKYLKFK